MKLIFSLFAALLLTTATFAQTAADPMQDPTAVGNAFFKAMLDEDGTISKYLTSDFSIISFDGQVVDGDLLAQAVGGGYVIIETGVVSDARTRQYNTDAAVMTGNWKVKGSVQGQTLDNTSAIAVLMVKQNGAWKISNVQFTPMK
ncbi:MAG: nuclear transport factor 2 family protein [Spirosoma sp.]|nr:nuclear transport factor 2 family protein [Spirosoma sp.]